MTAPAPDLAALLDELGQVAGGIGPVLAPAGGDDLVDAVLATARRLFDAAACSLALLTDDGDELVFTTVVGAGADTVRGLRVPAGQGIAGWVAVSGQPLFVSDLSADPRWLGPAADETPAARPGSSALAAAPGAAPGAAYVPRSILAAPVATSERLLGVLEVLDRSEDRAEGASDLELLSLVADQAALALEGARAFDDFGRRLLRAAAAAAGSRDAAGDELAAVLRAAADALGPPDDDLLRLARLFAELGRADARQRRLAVEVVSSFLAASRERAAQERPSGRGPSPWGSRSGPRPG